MDAWYNLGVILYGQGQKGEALFCFENAAYLGNQPASAVAQELHKLHVMEVKPAFAILLDDVRELKKD